jgi:hypothetical protein
LAAIITGKLVARVSGSTAELSALFWVLVWFPQEESVKNNNKTVFLKMEKTAIN